MHTEEEKDEIVFNGTPDERKCALEDDLMRFALYYFDEFFTFETPDFHYDMLDDLDDLDAGIIKEIMWCMYRESSKTSWAQMYVIQKILYRKFRFINVDAYDKDNAEAFIFDIANYLQNNEKIIADFGNVYITDEKTAKKQKEMKRVDKFDTTTGIRVEAFSTQTSTRGRKYKHYRPDLFVLDDFETTKTADSYPLTKKIIDHIDEIRGGVGQGVKIMYLCNYVTETGSVQYIRDLAKNAESMRVRQVDIIMDGEITWPSKFVRTKAEAIKLNAGNPNQKTWVMSIEEKKETLGEKEFEKHYMNNPGATQDMVFDREKIEELLKDATDPKKNIGGLEIWADYNAKHRYALGADTSEGVGRDSNAAVIIDFSAKPALVVATYANNQIAPDTFGDEIKREANIYGECFIAPEVDNTGHATVGRLRQIYPLDKIYKRIRKDLVTKKITQEVGWKTTGATKTEIIYQLKTAVEDGELKIYDKHLLEEIKFYTQNALTKITYAEGMTKHFDKLMACAIAWEMRNHAVVMKENKEGKTYKQPAWESTSSYQG